MDEQKPIYEVPQVVSYTDDEILEELGEAHAIPGPPPASGFQ